jgi:hypothetical protein
MSRALRLLARLARQELEAERRHLAETEGAMALLSLRRTDLGAGLQAELSALGHDPAAIAAFSAYALRLRAEGGRIDAALRGLEAERARQWEAFHERLVELRRLDILVARASTLEALRAAREEQRDQDEAAGRSRSVARAAAASRPARPDRRR